MNPFRSLAKSPLFTLAAVATLALGIGANTAVFSVLHSVVLAPLPYGESDRIVLLPAENRTKKIERGSLTREDLDQFRAGRSFSAVAGMYFYYYNITGISAPAQVTAANTSEDYFKVYGVAAALGRTWEPRDFQAGAAPAAVIGHSLWQTRMGGDRNVVGKTIQLDDKPYTVVGVMPPRFRDLFGINDLWVASPTTQYAERSWNSLARLKSGVTLTTARAEVETLAAGLARSQPATHEGWTITPVLAQSAVVDGIDTGLLLLGGAGACLLLITCANVGGLVLARAQARRREVAIRLALGATRGDLARQFLGEGLVLAVLGGGLGALLAHLGVPLLVEVLPSWFPRSDEIAVNAAALAVTGVVSTLTGVLFGLLPVLQARRTVDPSRDLAARTGDAPGAGRARSGLLVAELALSVVLLCGAGLMIRSIVEVQQVPAGIRADGLHAMVLNLSPVRYTDRPARRQFFDALLERVRTVPGLQSASLSRTTPFTWGITAEIEIDGRAAEAGETRRAFFDSVDAEYFQTTGMSLKLGRLLQRTDDANAPWVVVINEAMSKRYFNGADAIGRTLRLTDVSGKPTVQIVGIVNDVKRNGLVSDTPLQMYISYQQLPPPFATLMVRPDPKSVPAVLQAVQKAIWSLQPDQPIGQTIDMAALVASSAGVPRLGMILFAIFAAVALALAAVGLYGLIAYSVGARTREIGVRMALGASTRDIFRLIVREGGVLVGIGLAIGLVAALATARLMAGLVFGISPLDPLSFGLVIPVLIGVAFVAAALPARRATKIDPNVALRSE
ncbi:MAG: ABC transporter permease [Verrucomicrobia bacterium]|nr:ABC transporter permease [Verrucomicrobiota bacterium]